MCAQLWPTLDKPKETISHSHKSIGQGDLVKALVHYNWNYKKSRIVQTHYKFFSQLRRFFQQFYMGNDFHNYFSEKIVVKIFVVCKGLKWNIPPSVKASSMYHLFDVHTFLDLTRKVCVLSTYLHSLLNNVWYVSVPNLIPLRRPSGVSLLLLSNCRAFKSLIVIHLNIALQWVNTTDHWIQIP